MARIMAILMAIHGKCMAFMAIIREYSWPLMAMLMAINGNDKWP